MKTQNDKKTPPIKQTIIFLHADSIFDNSINKSYSVQGDHHNIINQSKQVKNNHQSNLEVESLQTEVRHLKNEVTFLRKQLEVTQAFLEKSLSKD